MLTKVTTIHEFLIEFFLKLFWENNNNGFFKYTFKFESNCDEWFKIQMLYNL
jgi:hypothetical protein